MTGLMSGLPALITSGLGWHPAAGPIPEFIWIGGSSPLCGTFIVLVGLSVLLFCLRVREAMLFFASSARPCVCARLCVFGMFCLLLCLPGAHVRVCYGLGCVPSRCHTKDPLSLKRSAYRGGGLIPAQGVYERL